MCFSLSNKCFFSLVILICECLLAECGPSLGLSTQEVQKQASHCNDKKTVSKRVQELSSELFFGVFVKVSNQNTTYCQQVGLVEEKKIFLLVNLKLYFIVFVALAMA